MENLRDLRVSLLAGTVAELELAANQHDGHSPAVHSVEHVPVAFPTDKCAELPGCTSQEQRAAPADLMHEITLILNCRAQLQHAKPAERAALWRVASEAAGRVSWCLNRTDDWTEAFLAQVAPIALEALEFVLDAKPAVLEHADVSERAAGSGPTADQDRAYVQAVCAKLVRYLPADRATWRLAAVRRACRRWLLQSVAIDTQSLKPALHERVAEEVYHILEDALAELLERESFQRASGVEAAPSDRRQLPASPVWRLVVLWMRTADAIVPLATLELLAETLLNRDLPESRHESLLTLLKMSVWHPYARTEPPATREKLVTLGSKILEYLQSRTQLAGRRLILWTTCLVSIMERSEHVWVDGRPMPVHLRAPPIEGDASATKPVPAADALLSRALAWLARTLCRHLGHQDKISVFMSLLARLMQFTEPDRNAELIQEFLEPALEPLWPFLKQPLRALVATHARVHAAGSQRMRPGAEQRLDEHQQVRRCGTMTSALTGNRRFDAAGRLSKRTLYRAHESTPLRADACIQADTCPWLPCMHLVVAHLLTRYDACVCAGHARPQSARALRSLLVMAVRALGTAAFLAHHGDCRSFFPWLLPILRHSLESSHLGAYVEWAERWDSQLRAERFGAESADDAAQVDALRYDLWLIGPAVCRGARELWEPGHDALWGTILERLREWLVTADDGTAGMQQAAADETASPWALLACQYMVALGENVPALVQSTNDAAPHTAVQAPAFRPTVEALLRAQFERACAASVDRRAPYLAAIRSTSLRLADDATRRLYFHQALERLAQLSSQPAAGPNAEAIALLLEITTALVDSETAPLLFDAVRGALGAPAPMQVQKRAYRALLQAMNLTVSLEQVVMALAAAYRQSHSAAEAVRLACIHRYFQRSMNAASASDVMEAPSPVAEAETTLLYEVVFGLRAASSRARASARTTLLLLVDRRVQQEHPRPSQRLVALFLAGLLADRTSAIAACLDACSLTTKRVYHALRDQKRQPQVQQSALVRDLERAFWEPLRALLHREQTPIVTKALLRAWKHFIPFWFQLVKARSSAHGSAPNGALEQASIEPLLRSAVQALDRLLARGTIHTRTASEIRGLVMRMARRCPDSLLESLCRSAALKAVLQSARKRLRHWQRQNASRQQSMIGGISNNDDDTDNDNTAALLVSMMPSQPNGAATLVDRRDTVRDQWHASASTRLDRVRRIRGTQQPLPRMDAAHPCRRHAARALEQHPDAATRRRGAVAERPAHALSKRSMARSGSVTAADASSDASELSMFWDDGGRLHVQPIDPGIGDGDRGAMPAARAPVASARVPHAGVSSSSSRSSSNAAAAAAASDDDPDDAGAMRATNATAPAAGRRSLARSRRPASSGSWVRFRARGARGDRPRAVRRDDGRRVLLEPYAYVPLVGDRRPGAKRKPVDSERHAIGVLRELVRPSRERVFKVKRQRAG
jgi:hypothetical protein